MRRACAIHRLGIARGHRFTGTRRLQETSKLVKLSVMKTLAVEEPSDAMP